MLSGNRAVMWCGNILLAFAIVLVLFFVIWFTSPHIFTQMNRYVYLLLIFTLTAFTASAVEMVSPKTLYLVPLYRQEKDWERLGYSLSRTTMANWVIRCSEDYFSRFVARLKEEMLKEDVLHCDETYVKVLKEKDVSDNSKQYMWVYRTGKHSERQIVIYDYNKSRSGDVAKKFLGDFSGYLHTDGYAGYNKLTKVTHCNCWAHLRRKFHEAIVVDSENSIAGTGRDFCDIYCASYCDTT